METRWRIRRTATAKERAKFAAAARKPVTWSGKIHPPADGMGPAMRMRKSREEVKGRRMKFILTLTAATLFSALLAAGGAQAAPAGPQSPMPAAHTGTLMQPVRYRHYAPGWRYAYWHRPYYAGFYGFPYYDYSYSYYRPVHYNGCRAWARECADRWGWRTWRWGRCMRAHAC
jgi:hypothetical protein